MAIASDRSARSGASVGRTLAPAGAPRAAFVEPHTRTASASRRRAASLRRARVALAATLAGAGLMAGCTASIGPVETTRTGTEVLAGAESAPRRDDGAFERAEERARRQNRYLVVATGAPWCGPCRAMERTVWPDARVKAWMDRHGVFVKVDIEQRSDLSRRWSIGAVPTTIVFRNGREVARKTSYQSASALVAWLESVRR